MTETESKISPLRLILPLVLLALFLLALSMPVSNLFLTRKKIEYVVKDPDFVAFSQVMQSSCVDCHSTNMIAYPIYSQIPPAKNIIAHDIVEAQAAFVLTQSQLSGASPIAGADLSRIATEINEGAMPPAKYKALHWNAVLSGEQKKAVLNYVKKTSDVTVK